jgi:hypothetical protein
VICETVQHEWVWASEFGSTNPRSAWQQRSYFGADLGAIIADDLSVPSGEAVEVLDPEEYYCTHGLAFRWPTPALPSCAFGRMGR